MPSNLCMISRKKEGFILLLMFLVFKMPKNKRDFKSKICFNTNGVRYQPNSIHLGKKRVSSCNKKKNKIYQKKGIFASQGIYYGEELKLWRTGFNCSRNFKMYRMTKRIPVEMSWCELIQSVLHWPHSNATHQNQPVESVVLRNNAKTVKHNGAMN